MNEQAEKLESYPTVGLDEPKVLKKHKFRVGDRVVIHKNKKDERIGVIIRLPTKGFDNPLAYVVELDNKDIGWIAKTSVDGVNSKNAWFASSGNMELLEDLK